LDINIQYTFTNVGPSPDASFNQNFNPEFALPAVVADITRVDRGYTDSPSATLTTVFDDFPFAPTNSYDSNNITFALGGIANHSSRQYVAQIAWNRTGAATFFRAVGPRIWTRADSRLWISASRASAAIRSAPSQIPVSTPRPTSPSGWLTAMEAFRVQSRSKTTSR